MCVFSQHLRIRRFYIKIEISSLSGEIRKCGHSVLTFLHNYSIKIEKNNTESLQDVWWCSKYTLSPKILIRALKGGYSDVPVKV